MRLVQRNFVTTTARFAALTNLLPLSFAAFFGTFVVAALLSPTGYDWRVEVISKLTSPNDNPRGYWLPAFGLVTAILLALPFADSIAQYLHGVTPRYAQRAGSAFKLSFLLMIVSVGVQVVDPLIGIRRLHTHLAQLSASLFVSGMILCCACALKDRFEGRRLLPTPLVVLWGGLTLLPMAVLAILGGVVALSRAGHAASESFRQSFRHTPLWHLAFWEWIGATVVFAFLVGSVFLLHKSSSEENPEASPATLKGSSHIQRNGEARRLSKC